MSIVYSIAKVTGERLVEAGLNIPVCGRCESAKGSTEIKKIVGPCPSSEQYMRVSRKFSDSALAFSWCEMLKFLFEAPVGDVEEFLRSRK